MTYLVRRHLTSGGYPYQIRNDIRRQLLSNINLYRATIEIKLLSIKSVSFVKRSFIDIQKHYLSQILCKIIFDEVSLTSMLKLHLSRWLTSKMLVKNLRYEEKNCSEIKIRYLTLSQARGFAKRFLCEMFNQSEKHVETVHKVRFIRFLEHILNRLLKVHALSENSFASKNSTTAFEKSRTSVAKVYIGTNPKRKVKTHLFCTVNFVSIYLVISEST